MLRRVLVAAAVLAACLTVATTAQAAGSFDRDFVRADPSAGAMFRWWWPGAQVSDAELRGELRTIAAAGYKGVEIADVMVSVTYPVDPDKYGYGTPRWNHAVQTALETARRLGLKVDLTLGAHWPAAVPGLDVNGPASSKELTYGLQVVRGGAAFSGAVPAPAPKTYDDRTSENGVIHTTTKTSDPRFVAVTAVACVDAACGGKPIAVDLASRVDLTGRVHDGRLDWTPPDGRSWVVTGYWYRGTAQRNDAPFGGFPFLYSDPEARVIDHFSRAGAAAFTRWFESLLSPRTLALLRAVGASVFEDSLEIDHAQAWTPAFLRAFEHRNGYSLVPYLPVLANDPPPGPFAPPTRVFSFSGADATVDARVRRDVDETIGALYLRDHVRPLERWAHRLGFTYRAQPYGEPIDLARAAAEIDVPECELLACDSSDDWRLMASGAAMGGRRILSDETLPGGFAGAYGLTGQDIVRAADDQYAIGANQLVWHGFPYARWPDAADGTVVDDASLWPGWHAFPPNPAIGEPFGPRQPAWTMASDYGRYYARTQLALQAGVRRTDVAVYNQSLNHISDAYPGAGLLDAGYSYGYVTPGTLRLPSAVVVGGRLAPAGPAFKALILDRQASMPLGAARRIRRLAERGLPVIVVGDPPSATPGYGRDAAQAAARDAALRRVVAALLATPGVHRVADGSAVPAALAGTGVQPTVTSSAAGLRYVHRVAGRTDLYYLYNPSSSTLSGSVTLSGPRDGVPYAYDAWSGAIERVAEYTGAGRAVTTSVALAPGDGRLVAVAPSPERVHVTQTTADAARFGRHGLVLRAGRAGTYTATLSDGRTVRRTIAGVPAAVGLSRWDLAVDEWRPGPPGSSSTTTQHVPWLLRGIALTAWSSIPSITDAVGVGTYTTTARLPAAWNRRDGAYLDLGAVAGAFRVTVNGRRLGPVDQLDTRLDVGRLLHAGANRIEVRVATPLLNRLRTTRPADFGARAKQDYGLLGPARLVPYAETTIG